MQTCFYYKFGNITSFIIGALNISEVRDTNLEHSLEIKEKS